MKTDTLNRRLRFSPPDPRGGFVLQPDDYLIFEAINRHGPLPTNYLFELQKHRRRNYPNFQRRLTKLYNGDEHGGYLVKPEQQRASYKALSHSLIYTLSPRGMRALAEYGSLALYPPSGSVWFFHQFMQACVGASFEVLAPAKGLMYIPREAILSRTGNGMSIKLTAGKRLIPDDVFALANGDGKKRYFLVEIDRATESIKSFMDARRSKSDPTYFGAKLSSYVSVLRSGALKEWWGMTKPQVLIVTTTHVRMKQIMDHLASLKEPEYTSRFYVTCEPAFGVTWSVPGILSHLLAEPWHTIAGLKDITKP